MMQRGRRYIALFLLWVSMLMLAMPVVPHHHHGHQAWICLKHDLGHDTPCTMHALRHDACAHHDGDACAHPDGDACTHHDGDACTHHDGDACTHPDGDACTHHDGDACGGHCCCHTGCAAHSVTPLEPHHASLLPAPQGLDNAWDHAISIQLSALLTAAEVSAQSPERGPNSFNLFHFSLPGTPSAGTQGWRAPPLGAATPLGATLAI